MDKSKKTTEKKIFYKKISSFLCTYGVGVSEKWAIKKKIRRRVFLKKILTLSKNFLKKLYLTLKMHRKIVGFG